MKHNRWLVAPAVLGAGALIALAPMASAAAPVRSAVIAETEQVGSSSVLYAGSAVQTDATLTAACAFTVAGTPGYVNANCRIHDRASDQSWLVPQIVSGGVTAEAATTWATTPAGVVHVLAADGEPILDTAGDYELCIQVDAGGVLGPEVCSDIK
jgi:hypothetical protein